MFLLWSPLFGVFGATVSHDVFQTSGLLLLTAVITRSALNDELKISYWKFLFITGIYLTTTQLGLLLFLLGILSLFIIRRGEGKYFVVAISTVVLAFAPNLPISRESDLAPKSANLLRNLILIDIKCIAQHPEAEITPSEWSYLETFSSRENWIKPTTCSNPDALAEPLKLDAAQGEFDTKLLKTALSIFARQPAIPVMSHIQRSRVALPPPFFQPPSNQISWDVNKPLGFGTNVALQEGPELLHPSIDDARFNKKLMILRPLEALAQLPTLLINQASWFWSWGGLWLYPLVFSLFGLRRNQVSRIRSLVPLVPTFALHFLLVVIGPSSLGRYVMSTILMGLICTFVQIFKYLEKKDVRENSN